MPLLPGALRAGGRALVDGQVWGGLLGAVLSLAALGHLLVAVVVLFIGGFVTPHLPEALRWLPAFVVAAWLVPPAMRSASATLARRALAPVAARARLTPQPLPPTSAWRTWWLPLVLCDVALPALLRASGFGDEDRTAAVLLVAQFAVAPRAVVGSLLAPWFPVDAIARTLATRRMGWSIATTLFLLAFALLHLLALAAWVVPGRGFPALADAWEAREIGAMLLARVAASIAILLGVAIFCTTGFAWFATATAAIEAGADPAAFTSRLPPPQAEATRPRSPWHLQSPGPTLALLALILALFAFVEWYARFRMSP